MPKLVPEGLSCRTREVEWISCGLPPASEYYRLGLASSVIAVQTRSPVCRRRPVIARRRGPIRHLRAARRAGPVASLIARARVVHDDTARRRDRRPGAPAFASSPRRSVERDAVVYRCDADSPLRLASIDRCCPPSTSRSVRAHREHGPVCGSIVSGCRRSTSRRPDRACHRAAPAALRSRYSTVDRHYDLDGSSTLGSAGGRRPARRARHRSSLSVVADHTFASQPRLLAVCCRDSARGTLPPRHCSPVASVTRLQGRSSVDAG